MNQIEDKKSQPSAIKTEVMLYLGIWLFVVGVSVLCYKIGANKVGRPFYIRTWQEVWTALPLLAITSSVLAGLLRLFPFIAKRWDRF